MLAECWRLLAAERERERDLYLFISEWPIQTPIAPAINWGPKMNY